MNNKEWFEAAKEGDIKVIKKYIDNKFDFSSMDYSTSAYRNALHYACAWGGTEGHYQIVKLLIEKSMEKNKTVNVLDAERNSPLLLACNAYAKDKTVNYEIIELLISNGADTHYANPDSLEFALFFATRHDKIEVMKLLLDKGADLYQKDGDDENCLFEAVTQCFNAFDYNKKLKIVDFLIDKGISVNSTDNVKNTPLFRVSYRGDLQLARYLIKRGADVNYKNEKNLTPISSAIVGNKIEVFKFLLLCGADLTIKNDEGKTPLDRIKNTEMIRYYESFINDEDEI